MKHQKNSGFPCNNQNEVFSRHHILNLYARLGLGREVLLREANRMIPRIEKSGMDINKDRLEEIRKAVEEQEVDYYGVIRMVETLIA